MTTESFDSHRGPTWIINEAELFEHAIGVKGFRSNMDLRAWACIGTSNRLGLDGCCYLKEVFRN